MSGKKTAVKKVRIEQPVSDVQPVATETPEPKKRASRAKKQPTYQETLKMLQDNLIELRAVVQELKDDETRVQGMGLKKVPELLKETIQNLEEDLKEMDEACQELLAHPDAQSEVQA